MMKYANRMVPRLPPKQIMLDSFLEERRSGLQRWLRLMSHHPLMSNDQIFVIFLTDASVEHQNLMQNAFNADPDEFLQLPASFKFPHYDLEHLQDKRELMRVMLNHVVKMKRLMNQQAKRELNQSKDFTELAVVLSSIMRDANDNTFKDFSNNFTEISKESEKVSISQQRAVMERLVMIIEVLTAHSDLCDRVEKTITSEHQALSKTININTQKFRNVIRGSDEVKAINDKQQNDLEMLGRRNAFALFCVMEETKFVRKYLNLLPSILLQFSHEEAKGFKSISEILEKVIKLESDKLN